MIRAKIESAAASRHEFNAQDWRDEFVIAGWSTVKPSGAHEAEWSKVKQGACNTYARPGDLGLKNFTVFNLV